MTFAHPNVLWLLLIFPPALAAFFWWSWRKRQQLSAQFIQARLLPALTVGISPFRQKIRLVSLILAVICLILALARPQFGFDWEEVKRKGLDIVVAIDTSKSMLAEDIPPNRLARAKLAALELMQQARSDRLGLVAFAGTAFLQCPLTIDDSAFRQSVESVDVRTLPQGGTAIAEAIDTARTAFKEGDNYRVLVLFTDGEDQDSGAVDAAKRAAEAGMQIFTIGIGSAEGEILKISDAKGRTDYIRDEQGNVVKSHLNESLLREIAGATSRGFYLPLRGAKTIDTLYTQGLAPMPKSESSEKLVRRYRERYHWPLAAAVLFLLIEQLLPERKRESRRHSSPSKTLKPTVAPAAAAILLFALPLSLHGSAASAYRDYQKGKYGDALKEYERLLERKKDDPRLHFNAGAAAYRGRQYEEAAKQFDHALNSPDLKLLQQAYYNRANSRFFIGEVEADSQKKQKTWEDSLQDFESALKLNTQDADAKFNRDFVKKKLEELKQQQQQKNDQQKPPEPSEAAKKAKAEADAAVTRHEYAKALKIMETQLKQDPTTAYYSDYIKRLKEVNGVQEPPKQ
jgi:Ca-activated chloride channel family protein